MFLGSLLKVRHKPKEGQTYQIPPTANFFGEVSRGSGDREGGRHPPPLFPPPSKFLRKEADRLWEYISNKLRL